jgi:hypothetical protein
MEFEGYCEGSKSYINHNPGNIKRPDYPHDESGHSIFPNFEQGWRALIHQLNMALDGTSQVYTPTDSLRQFFYKYSEANSGNYAEFVAKRLGVSPDMPIKDVFNKS